MEAALRRQVRQRANGRCEYCQMPEEYDPLSFEIEHIVPQKHGGLSVDANLAVACFSCNRHKGPNLAGLDPQTGALTQLFNPRNDMWRSHFQWNGPRLSGLTDVGRTTIEVLRINASTRMALRAALIDEGVFS